ncbi:MAG: hypothetical protein B7C54_03900 [Acidimicrobiales bacterium mtb01]|nr:hypothetical protein [Actinomycetota bacterium]TEX46375.1 MAG: hypothetical protein B7C54_03900 [Acidimicrobiales bacterium mtb01]
MEISPCRGTRPYGGIRTEQENFLLIIDLTTSLATALVCVVIVAHSTKERRTSAMRWIRAGVLVLGLGALGDFFALLAHESRLSFPASMSESILWSILSTIGVTQFLRGRRGPSRTERITTLFAALSSSFGLVWLIGLGTIVRKDGVGSADRVLSTIVLFGIALQIAIIVVTLKRTEHASLPGFSTFAGGSLTISVAHAMSAFDHIGIVSISRALTGLFSVAGTIGLGVSLWITNSKRPVRSRSFLVTPLFYAPATIAVVISILKYADTVDEYVFGLTSMVQFAMLIGQTTSHRSAARRTQVALERRVTQRTHELQQANQLVNRAFEFTADGIIALDPEKSILFMNPASRRMLGDTGHVLEMIRTKLLIGETCFDLIDEMTSPPGTIRVIGARLDSPTVSWVLTLRDVTEEMGLLRMKTRMLTAVSHEIRTPLTSLHGSLALLDSGTFAVLPPEAEKLVSIARTSSDRLLRLVNEYLDFERLNSRKPETLTLRIDDLAAVVEEVGRLMGPLAANRMIRLVLDADRVEVPMARDQIVQVLSNLVHNAIKFSSPDCIISVEARRSEEGVTVSVLDRGRGLRPTELERIFEPFFQSSVTENLGGTGMGLSICHSIVSKHGGRIWAEVREGGGAAFRFSLPAVGKTLIDRLAS